MINFTELNNQGYDEWQIHEMRSAERAGVSEEQIKAWLMDKRYKLEQIVEIREGLEAGIDVSIYTHLGMSAEEMRQTKEKLIEQKQINNPATTKDIKEDKNLAKLQNLERSYEQHQNQYLSLVSACMCLAILSLIISFLVIIVVVLLLKG